MSLKLFNKPILNQKQNNKLKIKCYLTIFFQIKISF